MRTGLFGVPTSSNPAPADTLQTPLFMICGLVGDPPILMKALPETEATPVEGSDSSVQSALRLGSPPPRSASRPVRI